MARGPFRPYAGGPLVWPDDTPEPVRAVVVERSDMERNQAQRAYLRGNSERHRIARAHGIDVDDVPHLWECEADEAAARASEARFRRGW